MCSVPPSLRPNSKPPTSRPPRARLKYPWMTAARTASITSGAPSMATQRTPSLSSGMGVRHCSAIPPARAAASVGIFRYLRAASVASSGWLCRPVWLLAAILCVVTAGAVPGHQSVAQDRRMAVALRRQIAPELEGDAVHGARPGARGERNHHARRRRADDGRHVDRCAFPGSDYEVRLEAVAAAGLRLLREPDLSGGDSFCTWVTGGWGGDIVGLSSIDGWDASDNETRTYFTFETGRWYALRLAGDRWTGSRPGSTTSP